MFHGTQGYWLSMSRGFPLPVCTGTGRYRACVLLIETEMKRFRLEDRCVGSRSVRFREKRPAAFPMRIERHAGEKYQLEGRAVVVQAGCVGLRQVLFATNGSLGRDFTERELKEREGKGVAGTRRCSLIRFYLVHLFRLYVATFASWFFQLPTFASSYIDARFIVIPEYSSRDNIEGSLSGVSLSERRGFGLCNGKASMEFNKGQVER